MFMQYLITYLQVAKPNSNDGDTLTKLFVLVLAALHAILHSTFFWFCVAGGFVSWWVSWIVRDAVKDAIRELDLQERVREAVREAMEEEQDD
jgi:hypothetical protein